MHSNLPLQWHLWRHYSIRNWRFNWTHEPVLPFHLHPNLFSFDLSLNRNIGYNTTWPNSYGYHSNVINGTIPPEIGKLTKLEYLYTLRSIEFHSRQIIVPDDLLYLGPSHSQTWLVWFLQVLATSSIWSICTYYFVTFMHWCLLLYV